MCNKGLFSLQFTQVVAWPLYNPTLFWIHDVVMMLQHSDATRLRTGGDVLMSSSSRHGN